MSAEPSSPNPPPNRPRYGPPWVEGTVPPPWWPEGEPWPPNRPPRGLARGCFLRVLILLAILVLIIAVLGWVAGDAIRSWHDNWQNGDTNRSGPPFWGPLIPIAILTLVGFLIVRRIRRSVRPLVDVMDAATRVAEGDYSVRLTEDGTADVRRMIRSFNEMTVRLDLNETQRQRLLADIAHEFRTPLSIIQGNIEGMLDGVYPRDDDHLAPLLDETRVIARLLNDLQTIATAEAGMLKLDREPTVLADLLHDVRAAFLPTASAGGVSIEVQADPGEVEIDPFRIRQVLDNLVANAIRYTPEGGTIGLIARRDPDQVTVTIADTGRGMAPEEAAHMFERFVKSKDSGGSGLGLAIAKSIIETHGGAISATSAPGKGTAVRFTLPTR